MTSITIPATFDKVVRSIGIEAELSRATEWRKAALLASIVRLHDHAGRPSQMGNGAHFESPDQFSKRGIVGLRAPATVRTYVQRWLDAHDGKYPLLGTRVTAPTEEWSPTRGGTDGYETEAGAERTIERLIERHGPGVIAQAVRRPEVAEAVVRDPEANRQTIRATGGVPSGTRRSGNGFMDESAQALANVLFDWGVLQIEQGTKDLYDHLVTQRIREAEWLPGFKEAVQTKVDEALTRLQQVALVLSTEVTDEDLQDLLNS